MLLKFTQIVNIIVKILIMSWIQERRKQLHYSQEDFARELQLSGVDIVRSTISHWESGRVSPPYGDPRFVEKLARVLRTDVMTVLQNAGYPVSSQHTEWAERTARLIDAMPEDKQKLALRLVEQLME